MEKVINLLFRKNNILSEKNKYYININIVLLIILILSTFFFNSCDKDNSYAELRKRENKQIDSFLKHGIDFSNNNSLKLKVTAPIKVINEVQFIENNYTTNPSKNEYVLFPNTGIYMQIIRKGTGEKLKEGETRKILARYIEYNIATDSIKSSNILYSSPEIMNVTNSFGNISGTFISGIMSSLYKTNTIPPAWLIPLKYIRIGRQTEKNKEIALVRLIVPSTQGQKEAADIIYPCFYEISYQSSR